MVLETAAHPPNTTAADSITTTVTTTTTSAKSALQPRDTNAPPARAAPPACVPAAAPAPVAALAQADKENTPEKKKTVNFSGEDEFCSPSKVIPETENSQLDLDIFATASASTSASALSRQSLYVKFDPLFGCSIPAAGTAQAPPVAAESAAESAAPATPKPAAADSGKLLDFATPEATKPGTATVAPVPTQDLLATPPAPNMSAMFTEEDVQRRVEEALKQSKEEAEFAQREIEDLRKRLAAEVENNRQMTAVVEEYGEAMGKMIDASEENKSGHSDRVKQLEKEKEQAEEDLRKTETAFSDLHHKYEKTKELVDNLKGNEQKLKDALSQAQDALAASEKRYQKLKSHAEEKIEEANKEIANVRDSNAGQLSVLASKLKKAEMELGSMKRNLEAKEKDNQELASICDDLVKQLDALGAK